MARIKKYAENLTQHLTTFITLINDTNPNSEYFRITEFKDTFTGGKNGFLIEGSQYLLESTEIKIEILDVDGEPIYYEPGDGIPEYYEGLSKLVSVHVYEDTPIGLAKITILGEAKEFVDSEGVVQPIPDDWKGVYNVKWEKEFKVNRLLSNEDRVRFYRRPEVSITEIVKPLFSNVVTAKTNTGTVSGIPLVPNEGSSISDFRLPTSYLLQITDTGQYSAWTGSVIGSNVLIPALNYTASAAEIINKTELVVTNPYITNGVVTSFDNQAYTTTFNYTEGIDNLATALTGSFAKINLTNLTSFVGDVARVKVFRKSQSDLSDYQFVQEVQLEANELLIDLTTQTKNQENYGLFTTDIIDNYWLTSSNNLTATYNQNFLYDSVKLDSAGTNRFYTSEIIPITTDVEYSLDFNVRLGSGVNSSNYIRAYLSGSRQSTINGVPTTIQIEQDITTLVSQNSILQKSTITNNIKAEKIDNARLYFEVVGSDWYVANVSFKASKESAFSPDEITFIQPVPRSLPVETFLYRFEFYDINNNYIPVLVEETKTFDGGNLQNIKKELRLVPSSLYFQFDSGSNPIPPTVISIGIQKTLLTGSVHFTSKSIDFFGDELSASLYTGGQYPGLLSDINSDNPFMTVQNFTGSREDKIVQYVEITGEVEGFTDTVVISRVLDGFGGVNHIIRPYRGTGIRNSSTQSLEIQAVRIDGVNDILLNSTKGITKGWPNIQLHVLSGSAETGRYINLAYASSSGFVKGLTTGSLGTGQINYNATFNRDSINKEVTVYLMPSSSNPPSSSVLASIILSDFQDGLDSGIVGYNADTFTINPRFETVFTPASASATASFYRRGSNEYAATASIVVYPSMSLDDNFEAHYYLYYTTHSFDETISVLVTDDKKNRIYNGPKNSYLSISESKQLNASFTYLEPYTSQSVNVDKTFTIVPEGKPGDETVIFEIIPANVVLNSNPKGIVTDYKSSVLDVKLKQGSRYLEFTGSKKAGTFHIAQNKIIGSDITAGNVKFANNYTASMIVSASSNFTQLSASIEFPLEIHPYYTSSIYTQSIFQNFTKAIDGAPQLEVLLEPNPVNFIGDEVGTISDYTIANTIVKIKEGSDFLTFNTSGNPGTFQISSINTTNILADSPTGTSTSASITYSSFFTPHLSASALYNIVAYPYSLGPGHLYTSSILTKTQNFSKNISPAAARTVKLSASTTTINFDGDGVVESPLEQIVMTSTAFNLTGSGYFRLLKDGVEKAPNQIGTTTNTFVASYDASEVASAGISSTWTVELRDGSASDIIRATDSLVFTGVQAGAEGYNVYLTNENASIVYTVQGTTEFNGTGTSIIAQKGTQQLTAVTSFSPQTLDQDGNEIGSLGEYRVTIYSKSSNIQLGGGLVSGSVVPVVGGVAQTPDITIWTDTTVNLTGEIVYRIDLENGKAIYLKTQSLSVNLEGRYGPGIVFRGVWDSGVDYIYKPGIGRRDAVLYPSNTGTYYAALSGSGPTVYVSGSTYYEGGSPPAGYTLIGSKQPDSQPLYWESLGQEEFFVAAKIAIFEESFVKNTLNVGTNTSGSNANIIINGRDNRPYIAVGQGNALAIGYGNEGIWMGTFYSASINTPRFSLVNGDDSRHLKWDGSNLAIKGSITVTGGDAATETFSSQSAYNSVDILAKGQWQSPTSTFITATSIFSPVIAANAGYISGLFRVGSYGVGDYSIGLDARTTNRKIFITRRGDGTGVYNDPDTSFYVDSDKQFSLGQQLTFDSSGNLGIAGTLNVNSTVAGGGMKFGRNAGGSGIHGMYIDNGNKILSDNSFSLANGNVSWNGTTLSVNGNGSFTGTITSTAGEIGGWFIGPNSLYSTNNAIYLDSTGRKITVNDSSNVPRVIISQNASFTSFSAGSSFSGTYSGNFFNSGPYAPTSGGSTLSVTTVGGSSTFTAASGTTYRISAIETSSGTAASWVDTVSIGILGYSIRVRRTTAPFTEYTIFGNSATVYGGSTANFGTGFSGATSFTGDGGIYELRISVTLQSYGAGSLNINSYNNPTFTWLIEPVTEFTEIIPAGIQTGNSSARYVKMIRGAATTMLDVGGAITATDNITAYASDERLKENIIKIDNPLDRVMQLKGVHYDWKANTIELGFKPSQRSDTGVLAQDVQRVLPNAVKIAPFDNDGDNNSKSGNNYLTVQYEKIVPLLIEAIKELKEEVDELKKNK